MSRPSIRWCGCALGRSTRAPVLAKETPVRIVGPPLEVESETPYLLAYTSGTTGRPKGALHVQGGFLEVQPDHINVLSDTAIRAATAETDRPSLVIVRSHIAFGSPHKQDTAEAHGSPLGEEEVKLTKQNLGWPAEPAFLVPGEVGRHFRRALDQGAKAEAGWRAKMDEYQRAYPELAGELRGDIAGALPEDWDATIPEFPADAKGLVSKGFKDFELQYIEGGILSARRLTGDGRFFYLKMFPDF